MKFRYFSFSKGKIMNTEIQHVNSRIPDEVFTALPLLDSHHLPNVDAQMLLEAFFAGRNAQTQRAYQQDIEDLRVFMGVPHPEAALERLIGFGSGRANTIALWYKSNMMDRGLKPATINRRLSALRSAVRLARILGMVDWSLEIPGLKTEAYRDTRGPGRGGFNDILKAARAQQSDKAKRDVAILYLFRYVGLRRREVANLDVQDVDFERSILWVQGKGRTQKHAMTIPRKTKLALRKWMEIRNDSNGALFYNFHHDSKIRKRITGAGLYHLVMDLGQRKGIKVTPHGLRHLAITDVLDIGVGIRDAQRFSRHADPNTLIMYDDNRTDIAGKVAQQLEDSDPGNDDLVA